MAKKEDPLKRIDKEVAEIYERADRWNDIMQHGCSDPFWPDGVNLNLIRNHIIFAKRNIQEICNEYGVFPPAEIDCDIPPKVVENLWCGPAEGDRFERLKHYHDLVIVEEQIHIDGPVYEPMRSGQISMF